MNHRIVVAKTDTELEHCSRLLGESEPEVPSAAIVARLKRQAAHGYRLAFLRAERQAGAVAGYLIGDSLSDGRFLFVDRLVAGSEDRAGQSRGLLLDWLVSKAIKSRCREIRLPHALQKFDARGLRVTPLPR